MCVLYLFAIILLLQPGIYAPAQMEPSTKPNDTASLAAAHSLLERGDTTAALAMLETLRKQTPKMRGISHELGLAYYRTGKLIEAEKAFADAMQEDPTDQESIQLRGLTLYRLGRPADAIPYLAKIRKWTPNGNADANYVLGLCYLNAQRYDQARQAFATQYGLGPDSGAAYLLLGNMLLKSEPAGTGTHSRTKELCRSAPAFP